MARTPVLPAGFELPLEPRLPRVGAVDAVALEERAATPGKITSLASKALRPDPADATVPSVAALCVYPNLVATAVERLRGSSVKVASVATAFPSGQSPLEAKLAEARWVVEQG